MWGFSAMSSGEPCFAPAPAMSNQQSLGIQIRDIRQAIEVMLYVILSCCWSRTLGQPGLQRLVKVFRPRGSTNHMRKHPPKVLTEAAHTEEIS